jgi:hypothetical protein
LVLFLPVYPCALPPLNDNKQFHYQTIAEALTFTSGCFARFSCAANPLSVGWISQMDADN